MAKKAAPKAAAKPAAKKTEEKKPAPAPAAKPLTKAELVGKLADATSLAKKDIEKVFDHLHTVIKDELGKKNGPGQFVLPGMLKLKVYKKPATKAKTGINPFTKEPMTIKAKPARNAIKVGLLKSLKDSVS